MKNIPITLFNHRDKDNSKVEGGGSKDTPKWVLDTRTLREHSFSLKKHLLDIKEKFDSRLEHNIGLPIVARVSIIDDAIAKSHRTEIAELFSAKHSNIIGFDKQNDLLIKLENETETEKILKNFSAAERFEKSLSAINEITLCTPNLGYSFEEKSNVAKIKLFNYLDTIQNLQLMKAFDEYCRRNEISVKKIEQYCESLFIYSVKSFTPSTLDSLKKFDGVFEISNMPLYIPEKPDSELNFNIPLMEPDPSLDYPEVGVLDSGISKNNYTSPWLVNERRVSHYRDTDVDTTHGTLVAGIILYGTILDGNSDQIGACRLIDFTVIPGYDIYEHELIAQIEETITANKDIKIWNLSLGTRKEIDPNRFSDFAIALDQLQDKYNILICKSVGNCENFKLDQPNSKISQSGDSVLSLVIGSIAHDKNEFDLADINHPSPFTRVGPGPAKIIKPDLVNYGGNVGLKDGAFVNNGIKSITPDGKIAQSTGTSFATPKITSLAASLSHNIESLNFDPILSKGLLIHKAKHPKEYKEDIETKISEMGYGLPSKLVDMLYDDEDSVTLVMREKISRGNVIDVFDFPFPDLVQEGYYYGKVTVTLLTKPILEPSQGLEYCQSELKVSFGTYDTLKKRDISRPTILNPYGKIGNKNFLTPSIFSKTKIKSHDEDFQKERILLNYHKKYQPTKKWVINLDEFQEANKEKYLKSPKKWFLKLRPYFRDFTENKYHDSEIIPAIEFCLLITIEDPLKNGIINSQVTENLDKLEFPNQHIGIRSTKESSNIKKEQIIKTNSLEETLN